MHNSTKANKTYRVSSFSLRNQDVEGLREIATAKGLSSSAALRLAITEWVQRERRRAQAEAAA